MIRGGLSRRARGGAALLFLSTPSPAGRPRPGRRARDTLHHPPTHPHPSGAPPAAMRRAGASASGSYRNLRALVGDASDGDGLEAGGPLSGVGRGDAARGSRASMDSAGGGERRQR